MSRYAIAVDFHAIAVGFGTEAGRVVLVHVADGRPPVIAVYPSARAA